VSETPRRYRDAKKSATVGGLARRMERDYGLPKGSVTIRNPTKKAARKHKTVGALKRAYKKAS
jgi:hypothetical protein